MSTLSARRSHKATYHRPLGYYSFSTSPLHYCEGGRGIMFSQASPGVQKVSRQIQQAISQASSLSIESSEVRLI